MEGISIMPGSIRPASANCAAGAELKEATGWQGGEAEGEDLGKQARADRDREREREAGV
jgi:hypothetical protein